MEVVNQKQRVAVAACLVLGTWSIFVSLHLVLEMYAANIAMVAIGPIS